MTGDFPINIVDHENRIPNDNSWDNIRPATYSENGQNRSNRNLVMGASWHKYRNKWQVRTPSINNSGQQPLGYYNDWFDAVCCRLSWEHKNSFKSVLYDLISFSYVSKW